MVSRGARSLFWLAVCGGTSYVLLSVVPQSDEQIKNLREKQNPQERKVNEDKAKSFMSVLSSASQTNKPLYRLTKEEIEKEVKK